MWPVAGRSLAKLGPLPVIGTFAGRNVAGLDKILPTCGRTVAGRVKSAGLGPLLATIRPMRPGKETASGDQPPEAVGEDAITC